MFQLIARHLLHTLNIIVVESFTTPHHYCPMSVQPLPALTVTSFSSGMELQKSLYFSISAESSELLLRKQREGERFFAKLDLFDVNENKYTTQPCEITLCFYGDTRIL